MPMRMQSVTKQAVELGYGVVRMETRYCCLLTRISADCLVVLVVKVKDSEWTWDRQWQQLRRRVDGGFSGKR